MFRHRQSLRRWAAQVLLLWLLGMGAAVATGCMASSRTDSAGHGAAQAHPLAAPHHAPAAADRTHHHGWHEAQGMHAHLALDDGQDPGSAGKTNCQDFCDKASVSIPPLKSALDDVQVHALTQVASTVVMPLPAFLPVHAWVPRRDGARAPPLHVAGLRLAL